MAVSKTALVVSALGGASIAMAAMAGAGMRLPPAALAQGPHGGAFVPVSTDASFSGPPGAPSSFADIFERVSPAVVSIHVTCKVNVDALRRAIPGLPFEIVPRGGDPDSPPPKSECSGSGFFISPDGYVVTANHVVDGAEDIKVITKDGAELKATVVGRDGWTDLAVLKVEGRNFPYVSFETSYKPRVGDWVVAVGNPFDLNTTATAGIISAYNREIDSSSLNDYMQIDAPINKGNSGGPTFDVYGRVVGVNSAIYTPSGGSVGIGFAIPATIAAPITQELIAKGKVTRGYIGATIAPLSDDLADSWGLSGRKGAQVVEIRPGGPAEKAGLQPGDVVVAVNGVPVKSSMEMTHEVSKAQAGQTIHLDVFRDGKERTIDVRSGTRPSQEEIAQGDESSPYVNGQAGSASDHPAPGPAVLGMEVAPLSAEVRNRFEIPSSVKGGVVIQNLKGASDAGDKLQRGDVIVQAGDKEIASVSDLTAAVTEWKKAGRSSIPLLVERNGQPMGFIPIKIEG
jgi:serine protease Do